MDFLTMKIINEILDAVYQDRIKEFGENSIIGCFVMGKANYGYATTINDIKIVTVYTPTFNELCVGTSKADLERDIIDIRALYPAIKEKGIIALELLFTDQYIITSKYKQYYTDLLKDRELIAHINKKVFLESSLEKVIHSQKNGDQFEAARTYIAADLYSQGVPCNDCYHIKDLLTKNLLSKILTENKMDIKLEDIKKHFTTFIEKALQEQPNLLAEQKYKQHIVNFVSEGLKTNFSTDDFMNVLTETEKKAFSAILKKLSNGQGQISMAKLIEETKISRPVFTSLLTKMKNSNFAEVNNQGVKGTYIKIRNIT